MAQVELEFLPDKRKVRVAAGTSIAEAAQEAGIELETPCGGEGRCGKCRVKIVRSAPAATGEEVKLLGEDLVHAGFRLACRCRPATDLTIYVPPQSRRIEQSILVEGIARELMLDPAIVKCDLQLPAPSLDDQRGDLDRLLRGAGRPRARCDLALLRGLSACLRGAAWEVTAVFAQDELIAVEPGDTSDAGYGIAFDIGTTTIVGYLIDLATGHQVAVASDTNAQVAHGEDIVTRIQFASEHANGLALLRNDVVGGVNHIIRECCRSAGIAAEQIYEVTIVGNTCMHHLLLGLPPEQLAVLPYVATVTAAQYLRAADLDIVINPAGRAYVLPNIAGFVGADTVGVILAADLDHSEALRVAIDIGTNGEVVVAGGGRIMACSTAAGPAFEGATISRGMRATSGAMDSVTIGDDVSFTTINGGSARGICGSGLIDAVAELRRVGVIDESGRMLPPSRAGELPGAIGRRLRGDDDRPEFVLAWAEQSHDGRPLTLSARDVRQLQLAKGALYTGVDILLDEFGADASQVEEMLLAGAFGNYVKRESAVAVGLIPALPLERIRSIGNAAGVGAKLALAARSMRGRAEELVGRVEYVELSRRSDFHLRFADAMMLAPLLPGASEASGR
jgi:uncharacterized 2Fe-2S/4Fe-4S cluster protein (DUF4445 family)